MEHDLVVMLAAYDFRLPRLEKVPGFEGDMVPRQRVLYAWQGAAR
jgi:hypothetical protein